MSYEGFEEYLCVTGHYFCIDYMEVTYGEGVPKACKCGAPWKWFHRVDETNGHYDHDPSTFAALRDDTGDYTEEERLDRHGNKYMVKHELFKPAQGSAWQLLEEIERKQAEERADFEHRRRFYIGFHENNYSDNTRPATAKDFHMWFIQREDGCWKKISWLDENASEEKLKDLFLTSDEAHECLTLHREEILTQLNLTEVPGFHHLMVGNMLLSK